MSTDDKTSVQKIDETTPVVWTAEDASRFLTSAIHEAQKPLADALKQRPITSRALTLLVTVLIIAALSIGLILSSQLEKTEKRAERAQQAREEMLTERAALQAQTQSLENRLDGIQSRNTELYSEMAELKTNEERYKRAVSELARFKQHNDLLRDYINGLEQEKAALSEKLMKALSLEPNSDADVNALVEASEDAINKRDEQEAPPTFVVIEEPELPFVTNPSSESDTIGGAIAPPIASATVESVDARESVASQPAEPAPAPAAVAESPVADEPKEPEAEVQSSPAVAADALPAEPVKEEPTPEVEPAPSADDQPEATADDARTETVEQQDRENADPVDAPAAPEAETTETPATEQADRDAVEIHAEETTAEETENAETTEEARSVQ